MDLYTTLQEKTNDLDIAVKELRKTATEYAEAYKNYRVLLARKMLELKADGFATTLAGDVARGDIDVAEAKKIEIIKEAIYKANQESINATKLQIKILENQISREIGL